MTRRLGNPRESEFGGKDKLDQVEKARRGFFSTIIIVFIDINI
jgi:hypothetical protein